MLYFLSNLKSSNVKFSAISKNKSQIELNNNSLILLLKLLFLKSLTIWAILFKI